MSHEPFSLFHHSALFLCDDTLQKLGILHASLALFVLQQQQNLRRLFGTSKMHLSPPPPVAFTAVRSKAVVLL